MRVIKILSIFFLIALLALPAFSGGKKSRFVTEDNVEIIGEMWLPEQPLSPGIILLHMLGRDRSTWYDFVEQLVDEGIAVVAIDFRGHGESIKQGETTLDFTKFTEEDFNNMVLDVNVVLDFFRSDQRIDKERIAIIGASIGANIALKVAASNPEIKAVVLLSPGRKYRGVNTEAAILDYGKRGVLIAASEEDEYAANSSRFLKELAQGDSRLLMYNYVGHGTNMLGQTIDLEEEIIKFLQLYLEP